MSALLLPRDNGSGTLGLIEWLLNFKHIMSVRYSSIDLVLLLTFMCAEFKNLKHMRICVWARVGSSIVLNLEMKKISVNCINKTQVNKK